MSSKPNKTCYVQHQGRAFTRSRSTSATESYPANSQVLRVRSKGLVNALAEVTSETLTKLPGAILAIFREGKVGRSRTLPDRKKSYAATDSSHFSS